MLSTCDKQSAKRVVSCSCEPGQRHMLISSFSILLLRGYSCAQLQTTQRHLMHGHTVWQSQHIYSCQAYPCILRSLLTAAKAVKPEEASHRASMKSRVAPKVLCLRRGDEGGDMTSGSGDTCSRPWDPSSCWDLCLSMPAKLQKQTTSARLPYAQIQPAHSLPTNVADIAACNMSCTTLCTCDIPVDKHALDRFETLLEGSTSLTE